MFDVRSNEPERIDTGDYTPEEYETFLREIAFINRYLGDGRALKKTLLSEIERVDLREFSVLDVGCGSGELLRMIAEYAAANDRAARLVGVDIDAQSSSTTKEWSEGFAEIRSVRGDALQLPFTDNAFDFAISSLFFHHLTDVQIVIALREMSRVSRRGIVVIDLHRDPIAYIGYKIFCIAMRISPLVRHDGSLSIRKGFREHELKESASRAELSEVEVDQISPGRVVLQAVVEERGQARLPNLQM